MSKKWFFMVFVLCFVMLACYPKIKNVDPGRIYLQLDAESICVEPLATFSIQEKDSEGGASFQAGNIAQASGYAKSKSVAINDYKLTEKIVSMQHVVFALCQAYVLAKTEEEKESIRQKIYDWNKIIQNQYNIYDEREKEEKKLIEEQYKGEIVKARFNRFVMEEHEKICLKMVDNNDRQSFIKLCTLKPLNTFMIDESQMNSYSDIGSQLVASIGPFDLGQYKILVLSDDGQKQLTKVFDKIKETLGKQESEDLTIHIVGHSDSKDFTGGDKVSREKNRLLSERRACIVFSTYMDHFKELQDKYHVNFRLSGVSNYEPAFISLDEDFSRKNRRVEISVSRKVPYGITYEEVFSACKNKIER